DRAAAMLADASKPVILAGGGATGAQADLTVAAVIPEDAVVAGDSSQITYYGMTTAVKHSGPKRFLYTPAYATLGYGLPAAIGAKIADPERPVVCVLGDGALMFALQEFQTAADQ
ncbi:thiamine pyrophosphate-dependent enzyme, partial [Brevibacterium paucivorans]